MSDGTKPATPTAADAPPAPTAEGPTTADVEQSILPAEPGSGSDPVVIGSRQGMFGAKVGGDTSGYGGLQTPILFPGAAARPYGSWFDEAADAVQILNRCFDEPTPAAIRAAVVAHRDHQWDAQAIMRHVERFSPDSFVARLRTEAPLADLDAVRRGQALQFGRREHVIHVVHPAATRAQEMRVARARGRLADRARLRAAAAQRDRGAGQPREPEVLDRRHAPDDVGEARLVEGVRVSTAGTLGELVLAYRSAQREGGGLHPADEASVAPSGPPARGRGRSAAPRSLPG